MKHYNEEKKIIVHKVHSKFHQTLGLATRARKTVFGEDLIITELENGKVSLLIFSSLISKNSYEKYKFYAEKNNVAYYVVEDAYEISAHVGKANIRAVAIVDKGFASLLKGNVIEEVYNDES